MWAATRFNSKDTLGRKSAILYKEFLIFTSEYIIGYSGYSGMGFGRSLSAETPGKAYRCCTVFEGGGKEQESELFFQSRRGWKIVEEDLHIQII